MQFRLSISKNVYSMQVLCTDNALSLPRFGGGGGGESRLPSADLNVEDHASSATSLKRKGNKNS